MISEGRNPDSDQQRLEESMELPADFYGDFYGGWRGMPFWVMADQHLACIAKSAAPDQHQNDASRLFSLVSFIVCFTVSLFI